MIKCTTITTINIYVYAYEIKVIYVGAVHIHGYHTVNKLVNI